MCQYQIWKFLTSKASNESVLDVSALKN